MNNKTFVLTVFAIIASLLYLFPEKQVKVSEDIAQIDNTPSNRLKSSPDLEETQDDKDLR